jgi:hypothetical protein
MINEQTNEQTTRNTPKESVWYQYEKIFTDDYKTISPEYKDFLMKFTQTEYADIANEPYQSLDKTNFNIRIKL